MPNQSLYDMKFIQNVLKHQNSGLNIDSIIESLEKVGQSKLLKSGQIDFSSLPPQKVRYELYKINKISQNLGYPTIEKLPQENLQLKSSLISDEPEKYFS